MNAHGCWLNRVHSRVWRPAGPLVSHQALAAYTAITDLCLAGIVGSKELRK